jgi:hypothetical protein
MLRNWLHEWANFQTESVPLEIDSILLSSEDNTTSLTQGQVRLLPPPGTLFRPCFVLILDRDAREGRWRVAPFSWLNTAASPDELYFPENEHPLKVLSFHGLIALHERLLFQSWFVQDFRQMKMQSSECGSASRQIKACFPSGISGPPCWHPADPRYHYFAEISHIMAMYQSFGEDQLGQSYDLAAEPPPGWIP